jgi:hypothetical protein
MTDKKFDPKKAAEVIKTYKGEVLAAPVGWSAEQAARKAAGVEKKGRPKDDKLE